MLSGSCGTRDRPYAPPLGTKDTWLESLCCENYRPVTYSMSQVGSSSPPLNKKEVPVGAGTSFGALFLAVAFRVTLQAAGCFEFFGSVGLLPGEVGVFAAEVTVGCRLFVDGATQV